MCVLTETEIRKELESGRLRIEPFNDDQIGAASIDLHLGDELRLMPAPNGPVHLQGNCDLNQATELIKIRDHYVLEPGAIVLGITRERIYLPSNLCAWIEGRSRIARAGLMVHVTSGFVHPGVANHQVLEMSNIAGVPLAIHPGLRVCQIVLERTEGDAVYRGEFAQQTSP